jgi:hypothetical protein
MRFAKAAASFKSKYDRYAIVENPTENANAF